MKISTIKVSLIDHMGSDLSIVNAARVSFDKESEWVAGEEIREEIVTGFIRISHKKVLSDRDSKLVRYLAKHKHTSPFNHCFATFRVKAPIFVARQLVKHKFMPWNEVSRRYVDSEPEFFLPEVWRKKADNVKQGSSEESVDLSPIEDMTNEDGCLFLPEEAVGVALATYRAMLKLGVCPEQARMVLPQNTMTEWIWSGTLGAWADMCRLRLDSHTQKETQLVATEVARELEQIFPVGFNALMEA